MILSLLFSAILMVVAIAFHYWSIGQLFHCLPKQCDHHSHFLRSLSVLFLLVCVHLIEIIWFAGGLYVSSEWLRLGALGNNVDASFMNFFYHSAVTYSTLGLSAIPVGHLKFMTALESLTGIILLTWSATFFYSVMGRAPERKSS
jgi:hypothetical protein